MGPGSKSNVGVHRLKFNLKPDYPELLMKLSGKTDWEVIPNFGARFESIDLLLNPGKAEMNISPYWMYKITLTVEGSEDETYNGTYIMEVPSENRFMPTILNVLATAAGGFDKPVLYFSPYRDKNKGYKNLHFYLNGDYNQKAEWKYQIEDQPRGVDTGILKPDGSTKWDYSGVDAFWLKVFKEEVYPAMNSKPWTEKVARDIGKVAKLKTNSGKMFVEIKDHVSMISAWKKIADWMKEHLQNSEDQEEIRKVWQAKASELSLMDTLNLDGTVGGDDRKEEVADDGLPF